MALSILHGHSNISKLLLKNGADPNGIQICGARPLSLILHPRTDSRLTLREKVELIDTLVQYGADPTLFEIVNKLNMNALDYIHQMLNPPPPIQGKRIIVSNSNVIYM